MTDLAQMDKLLTARAGELAAGPWTSAPAVPLTTVAAVNTSGHDAMVLVGANGATISSIKVDGVTVTGVTSGFVPVRAGSSITLAYTVATPVWQWWLMS